MRGLIAIIFIAFAFGQALYYQNGLKAVIRITGQCTLHGGASYDPNPGGRIISWRWSQVSGARCNIISPGDSVTSVTGLSRGIYVFSLKVVSSENLSDTAHTIVTVRVN